MSSRNPGQSVLETVAQRYPVLETLEGDPRNKRDLVEDLDCSRSTIDRAVRELESLGLIERIDGDYRLTIAGDLVLEKYRSSVEAVDSIAGVSDVFDYVPRGAPMAACVLEGARIDRPEPHAPNEPLRRVAKQVTADVDRFRGISGSERIPHFREHLYEHTVDGTLDAEVVITDQIATFLLSNHPTQVQDVITDGDFDFHVIDSVPYGLIILETPTRSVMFLVIYAEPGVIVIENNSREAIEWADGIYRRYRAIATPFEVPDTS